MNPLWVSNMNFLEDKYKDKSIIVLFGLTCEFVNSVLSKISIENLLLKKRAKNVCSDYYIYSVADLVLLSPQDLLDMKNSGVLTVNQIIDECKKVVDEVLKNENYYIEEKILDEPINIDFFKDKHVTKDTLVMLPLFSENYDFSNDIDLHSSYRGEEYVNVLNLSVRAMNVISALGLINIKQLLLKKSSELLLEQNCGTATINEIRSKIESFYFVDLEIKNIYDLVDACPQNKSKKKSIFLDYLCNDNGSYDTFNKIAEKYNISRQRVQQITETFISEVRKVLENNNNITIFDVIKNNLNTAKGPISISSLTYLKIKNDIKNVEMKRMLRLYYLLSKSIVIDTKSFVFWDSNDKCIKCSIFSDITSLSHECNINCFSNLCIDNNCELALKKKFDLNGLNKYKPKSYNVINKESNAMKFSEKQNIDRELVKPLKCSYDYYKYFAEEFDEKKYSDLFSFISKKNGTISHAKFEIRLKKIGINLNFDIELINSYSLQVYNKRFLTFDEQRREWEVDESFNKHPYKVDTMVKDDKNYSVKEGIEKSLILNEDLKKDISNYNQVKQLIDRIVYSNSTSYMYYWYLSLKYMAKNDELSSSFYEMAEVMCAFAWNDVFFNKMNYSRYDQIPFVIKNIYLALNLEMKSDFSNVLDTLINNRHNIDIKENLKKIIKYVPYRFLSPFITGLTGMKDSDKNLFIEKASTENELLYKIVSKKIIINKNYLTVLKEI